MNAKNPTPRRRTLLLGAAGLSITSGVAHAAPLLSIGSRKAVAPNAWIEVNLTTFENNLRHVMGAVGATTQVCAVMKADAYGAGIELLMPSVIAAGVPAVGITSTEEARVVRASGFRGRVLRIRNAAPSEVEAGLSYGIEELVGSLESARLLAQAARKHHRTVRVHLALNSGGMSRNGIELRSEQGKTEVRELTGIDGLRVVGLMTHFAVNERPAVLRCLADFRQATDWLFANTAIRRGDVTLHASNSYATLNVPEAHLDMVRPGGSLYGYQGPRPAFQHAVAFKTRVGSVQRYPAGNAVGYDGTFTLTRDSVLANLPVGYSDGYRRAFSNKGTVLVGGQRAPVLGRISMNTTMVDITDIPGVKPGDEVVLFGKQGGGEVTKPEIEQVTGVIMADQFAVWGTSNQKVAVR